jgi:L-rhamnose-H+ transport protein
MTPNPFLGVVYHWLGGLASGSFYVPYRFVRRWSWEVYWLAGGFFSWIIAPWLLASLLTKDLPGVLSATPAKTLFWTYFFGAMWGLGGLTFGLTMRYLGMSLGMAIALGYTAAFGTLIPPLFDGSFFTHVIQTTGGLITLAGVLICLLGIVFAGLAGQTKEKELPEAQKKAAIQEFDFKKGLLVATFSGIMSASFAYGLAAADPIKALSVAHGTDPLWQGLPALVVVLLGGFTTNALWCSYLLIRNRTLYQYTSPVLRDVDALTTTPATEVIESPTDAPAEEMAQAAHALDTPAPALADRRVPLLRNYVFSALAGVTWYLQFFFYTMGETKMGDFKFSSWTLHMASIIIFSSLWGIALSEWKGASSRAKGYLALSLAVLIGSTIIIGYGNYLAQQPASADAPQAPAATAHA